MTDINHTAAELFAAHTLASQVKKELTKNILPFWTDRMVAPERGFYGRISGTGILDTDAALGAIMNARILWTFSSAARALSTDPSSEETVASCLKTAERAKKEIQGYSTMSERDRHKIDEYYVYDGDELKKAIKEVNKNNPEYVSLKKEYKQTISSYKEECKRITNEIIGDYGDNKISGLGTDMNYRELVYYALSKGWGGGGGGGGEDMGRK